MNQSAEEEDSFWLSKALEHGGNANVVNEGNGHYPNSTPLFYAIYKERVKNVMVLVKAGADVNHRNGHGVAPLLVAAGTGKYEAVVTLLEAGADQKLLDNHGNSLATWFNGRNDCLVADEDQIPWFRKQGYCTLTRFPSRTCSR